MIVKLYLWNQFWGLRRETLEVDMLNQAQKIIIHNYVNTVVFYILNLFSFLYVKVFKIKLNENDKCCFVILSVLFHFK